MQFSAADVIRTSSADKIQKTRGGNRTRILVTRRALCQGRAICALPLQEPDCQLGCNRFLFLMDDFAPELNHPDHNYDRGRRQRSR